MPFQSYLQMKYNKAKKGLKPAIRNYVAKSVFGKYSGYKNKKRYLPIGGFPSSQTVKLRFVETIELDASIAEPLAKQTYIANDMYATNGSSTHQPSNFDRWVGVLYDHFSVVSSTIKVTHLHVDNNNFIPSLIGVTLSDNGDVATTTSTLSDVLEQRFTNKYKYTTGAIAGKVAKVSHRFNAKRFFKKSVIGSADYRGSASNSPSEKAFYEVWSMGVKGNNPGKVTLLVEIEFVAVLTEPKKSLAS